MTTLLIVIIILALIFDFINGFHDAANSIATVVSTKVLSPLSAVIWAAMFNFIAYFIFTCFFYYLGYHQFRLVFCFTMVCVCVFVQKSLGLTVHLVGFIQEMVDIKYRKLMLLLTLTLATIKFIFPMI